MSRINLSSVAAVAALSAALCGFAAPSAFAKDNATKMTCCGKSCCHPVSSCCDSAKSVKKVAAASCCAPRASCCQSGSSCCAGMKSAAKKAGTKASKLAVARVLPRA